MVNDNKRRTSALHEALLYFRNGSGAPLRTQLQVVSQSKLRRRALCAKGREHTQPDAAWRSGFADLIGAAWERKGVIGAPSGPQAWAESGSLMVSIPA